MTPLACWLMGAAFAQDVDIPPIDAQLFRPALDGETTLWVEDVTNGRHLQPSARVLLSYANSPLMLYARDGRRLDVIESLWQTNLVGAFAYERFRFGLDVPVVLAATSDVADRAEGISDIGLDARWTLFEPDEAPVGFALDTRITVPSSTVESALGRETMSWELSAIGDLRVRRFGVLLNLGTRGFPPVFLPNTVVGDHFFARGALTARIDERFGVAAELVGHAAYGQSIDDDAAYPVEGLLGGWARIEDRLSVQVGFGRGLSGGIGASQGRGILAVAWTPASVEQRDTDGDTVVDRIDRCADQREDLDGFDDQDGCVDADDDADGISDEVDFCIGQVEDADGFRDHDGCPDPSTHVHVRILGAQGAPLPAARVVFMGEDDLGDFSWTSGDFAADLHAGTYILTAEAAGYRTLTTRVRIPEDGSWRISYTLAPAGAAIGAVPDSAGASGASAGP